MTISGEICPANKHFRPFPPPQELLENDDGSYLVRKSSGVDALQPYTLVVFYNGRVYNIPVRYIPTAKQYALGKQKNREERFKTVSEIIENHQKNMIVLVDMQSNTKDATSLRHAVKP
ncbi:B-cell linker protein isoform X1 [Tachysurus ichikawai]